MFYFICVYGILYFNMLLGSDYVYVMNVVVSILFWVIHCPQYISIVTMQFFVPYYNFKVSSSEYHTQSCYYRFLYCIY
jgi:hypothetical protein